MNIRIQQACEELDVLNYKRDCFVITRFNLHLFRMDKENNPVLTDDWLRDRFELFESYCLPSLKNQTVQSFYWIVLFASDTPESFRQRALDIHSNYNLFLPFFLNDDETKDYNGYVKNVIRLLKDSSNLLITIRVDNDDAIKCDFVESAYHFSKKQGVKEHLYTYAYGIQYYASANLADRVLYPHNHFVILVDKFYEENAFKCVLQYNHGKIHLTDIPFISIKNKRNIMWVEVIHDRNVDNDFMMQPHHRPIFSKRLLIDNYGWSREISPIKTILNIPYFLIPTAINHAIHRLKQKFGIIARNH